jgi:tetratricopeptide (TPR) repeat protein
MVGHIYLERGEVSEAMRVMEQAIQAGEQSANPATQIATRADLGWVYGMLGAPERGIELARLAQGRAEILYPLFRPWATAVLARLYLLRGQISEAQAALQECYRDLKPEGSFHAPLWVALADGELAMAQGNYPHVISLMDDLLAYLRRLHSRPYRTDALYLKGRALTSLGRLDEAEQVLASARAEAEALGSRRGLWPILAALGTIAARQGDRVAESNLHTQAREIAEYIADRAPTSELGVSLRRMHGLA